VQPYSDNRNSKVALVQFESAAEATRALVSGGGRPASWHMHVCSFPDCLGLLGCKLGDEGQRPMSFCADLPCCLFRRRTGSSLGRPLGSATACCSWCPGQSLNRCALPMLPGSDHMSFGLPGWPLTPFLHHVN
jgi:hypothetical protein